MEHLLRTPRGATAYAQRSYVIEPIFGDRKHNRVPILMLAVLFGLSMDYEVFLVSRIHEEWLGTRDNAAG